MSPVAARVSAETLPHVLRELGQSSTAGQKLQALVDAGFDELPLPGGGATLDRWRALAAVAEHDLSLAKLFEGHTDALAIVQEVSNYVAPERATWGMWAAEAPGGRAQISSERGDSVLLNGVKCWCSGAAQVSHALLTAWRPGGAMPQLVAVELAQAEIRVDGSHWKAVGMADSTSFDVVFDNAKGVVVGNEGSYLARRGFWHGGAGIAACWFGGARMLATRLHRSLANAEDSKPDSRLSALGAVDTAMSETAALLRTSADWIDAHPTSDAVQCALRVRASAERCAVVVLSHVGRSLGATPFCRDYEFARMASDLPVYIRQSHAERDLAMLGNKVRHVGDPWNL